MSGINGTGMDKLRTALLEKAAEDCLAQVMRGNSGRAAYVIIVAADGHDGGLSFTHSPMNVAMGLQFAQAVGVHAGEMASNAQKGLLAVHQRAALKQAKV